MATRTLESPNAWELLRAEPIQWLLVGVLPVAVAVAQVTIAVIHGSGLVPSVAFAVGLVTFAAVATTHQMAAIRVRRLESAVHDR